ncbi:hypothetical protein SAMN05443248_2600 [Bradyrhizobium erythrophlei]|uniref:Uncharacterized protein n=1 Tax=Bradyrhizobium erythrophlei TaxID=1437360 RepID=A0A1M5MI71_9BRAD|nr:hypothetical protein SAMN05443248_2600 [Bradyrhizobium erythrophlei]
MPGARCTRSLVCAMGNKYAHEYSQRAIGKHPTFPHAMVYGLYRALPGDRLSCHRRYADRSANLTPASGCQDHTSSPSAASNARQARRRVHRIPPRVRDVASRPSEWDGMGRDILLIWVRPQAMFLKIRSEPKCRRGGWLCARECAPDDRLREAIHRAARESELLRRSAPRNDAMTWWVSRGRSPHERRPYVLP